MNRQELVQKMYNAVSDAPTISGIDSMDAALSVAIEELLAFPSHDESFYNCELVGGLLTSRRVKLERVKTPEERVTVVRLPMGADVLLDAEWQLHFDSDSQAEIYRLGLIQQLKEQLPKNQ